MWTHPQTFDVIVIGAGHAGSEAAYASSCGGARTLLLTMNLDTIGKMSCNPSIGGTAKGHIVREIDALGGMMGKIADQTAIHCRMLNASKGPAVWSPRTQNDRFAYQMGVKHFLEKTPNISIAQGTIEKILVQKKQITGVLTKEGVTYEAPTVIISAGTFMRGLLHIGDLNYAGGRAGDKPSVGLSANLKELGFSLGRLKTGTPPRIHRRTIDFSELEEQKGDANVRFSFDPLEGKQLPQVSCYITYTTAQSHQIVADNLHRSALYSGKIEGTPTRYCPSIEDKIVRFADKERHQIFLEPEGLQTEEFYVNGLSSSLPPDVQYDLLRSVIGLENAEIMRPAYAIEYDYVTSGQLDPTLETRSIAGLYLAGQINGTTGYEEAAGQGLIAGINAANKALGKEPFFLKRSEGYIGVMIDDLITKELDEPYRMFTSRAEHRLLLRQDNADLRLRSYGYEQGLISEEQHDRLERKKKIIDEEISRFSKEFVRFKEKNLSLFQLLSRPEITYEKLLSLFPEKVCDHGLEFNQIIEFDCKFHGYIKRQEKIIAQLESTENVTIHPSFDYDAIEGLRIEAREKLSRFRPITVGQASRIGGISPADISILLIRLKSTRAKKEVSSTIKTSPKAPKDVQ